MVHFPGLPQLRLFICLYLDLETGFRLGNGENLDRVINRSCSCICKIDFRLLNHLNRTSKAQVMVHFPELP